MSDPQYYSELRERFTIKQQVAVGALTEMGFHTYESGSAFYLWTRIPEDHKDAMQFNQMLIERAGVAGVPGSAFADSDRYDNYLRLCIAREDEILRGALDKLQNALSQRAN